DCQLESRSPEGAVLMDLVKGGRHFGCQIDLKSGQAQLSIDGLSDWRPTAQTDVRGAGSHHVQFANADRELLLWIDGKLATFDMPTMYGDLNNERPRWAADDAGDLAPLGIGSRGATITVSHLRVLRDVYYIAARNDGRNPITDFREAFSILPQWSRPRLAEF